MVDSVVFMFVFGGVVVLSNSVTLLLVETVVTLLVSVDAETTGVSAETAETVVVTSVTSSISVTVTVTVVVTSSD